MRPVMPRWTKRLSVPGARLLPDGSGDGFAIYPGGDRRRRPMARVSRAAVEAARAQGWLTPEGEGFVLSTDFRRAELRAEGGEIGFRMQHGGQERAHIAEDDGRISVRVRLVPHSPLVRLARPGPDGTPPLLDRAEYEAGERLRADHARSTLSARMTSDWTAPPRSGTARGASGPEDAPLSAIAAKDRVMNALDAIGPGLDRVVFAACIRETGLMQIEAEEGWPKRSAKIALKLGLTRLAVHYGMKPAQAVSASA